MGNPTTAFDGLLGTSLPLYVRAGSSQSFHTILDALKDLIVLDNNLHPRTARGMQVRIFVGRSEVLLQDACADPVDDGCAAGWISEEA